MSYYDSLNLAIAKSLSDYDLKYPLSYLNEISKLAEIVIENTPNLDRMKYTTKIPIQDSIQLNIHFFSTIKKEYSDMFQNILKEENYNEENGEKEFSVKFYRMLIINQKKEYEGQHYENQSDVRKDGFVHIDFSETLEDIFTISHEITHKFSQPMNQMSTIKQFLGESSTIAMEYLMQDFLMENTEYSKEEIGVHKNNRLIDTYDDAAAVLFEKTLLELYLNHNNYITKEILFDYLNSMDKNSKIYELFSKRGMNYLDSIVKNGSLQFYKRQRYVIGTVLASDLHYGIRSDYRNKEKLCYLIDVLGHTDFVSDNDLKLLENMNIPIIEKEKIYISDNNLEKLKACYKKDVLEVLALSNMQSKNK